MNLNVNDVILYGNDGVCRVIEKVKKKFAGQYNEYYILKPVHNETSTIYVPVDGEKLSGKVRQIISKEEIYSLIELMPQKGTIWIDNESARKDQYKQILSSGDRSMIISLIKTLYIHGQERKSCGKKMHLIDERFMHDAEKIIYEEFSHVLDIRPDQVLPFILEQVKLSENA